MEDYNRSRSYGNGGTMQIESHYGPPAASATAAAGSGYDLAQSQMGNNNKSKVKKVKSTCYSSNSEFQRKRRVASYKMYSMEGMVKGSFKRSFRWLKDRYTHLLYGC